MLINKIEIKNYKLINDEPLILDSLGTINYLVGENGSGKSSILEILRTHLSGRFEEHPYNNVRAFNQFGDLRGVIPNTFNLKIDFRTRKKLNRYKLEVEVNKRNYSSTSIGFRYNYDDKKYPNFVSTNIKYDCFYGSHFLTHSDYALGAHPLIESVILDLENLDEDVKDLIKFLNRFHFNGTERVVRIYKSLQEKPCIQIETTEDRVINLKSFSSGFKSLLSLYYSIHRYVRSLNVKSAAICLEEPEVSFHPKFQKLIPSILEEIIDENPQIDVQFFIATHSPFIISSSETSTISKSYLISRGKTSDRAMQLGRGAIGFSNNKAKVVISEMLGSNLTDLSIIPKISEKIRFILCEGNPNGDMPDSLFYQEIFPTYLGIRNIFASYGGATDVVNAFYCVKESAKLIFGNDVEVLYLIDRSCGSDDGKGLHIRDDVFISTNKNKPIFTEVERNSWLKIDPIHRRMLIRKEIENYLYDLNVLRRHPENTFDISSLKGIDFMSGEVKDIVASISKLSRIKRLDLAKTIKKYGSQSILVDQNDKNIKKLYDELADAIFKEVKFK